MAGEHAGTARQHPRKVTADPHSGHIGQDGWARDKDTDYNMWPGSHTGTQGVPADMSTQLKNCAHSGDVALSESLLETLLKEEGTVSVEDYNYVIHACATARDVIRAEGHLSKMISMGLHPNLVSFNSVINACAMDGDVVRAELWLGRMVQCGVKPTEVTFGTICKVLARQGLVTEIQGVMKEVEKQGLHLNEYFYASLISACGVASPRNVKEAVRAFEDLLSRGLRAQSVKKALERVLGQRETASLFARTGATRRSAGAAPASAAMMGGSPSGGQYSTPASTSDDHGSNRGRSDTKSSTDSIPPAVSSADPYTIDAPLYTRVSPASSHSAGSPSQPAPGLTAEPWKIVSEPRTIKLGRSSDGDSERSTGPGSHAGSHCGGSHAAYGLAAHLTSAAHSGDIRLAEYLLDTKLKEQGSVTVEDYNCVINACTRAGDAVRAEHHLNRMASLGLSPSTASFEAVVEAYARLRDVPMARLWLERMFQYGLQPREATISTVRAAISEQGLRKQARGYAGGKDHHLSQLEHLRVSPSGSYSHYPSTSAFSLPPQGSTPGAYCDESRTHGGFVASPSFQPHIVREIIRV